MSANSNKPQTDSDRTVDTAMGWTKITPQETDLGELTVHRLLPNRTQRQVGPWVFFDHFGPVTFAPGQGIDVRPHPHINLATVTYLFDGELLHRDSLGNVQAISPGAVNLMVAGRGIVHSEREAPAVRAREHALHGLQLWLALPDGQEEIEPAFLHYPDDAIPAADVDGIGIRVMIGSAYGVTSPVRTFADTLYYEASLAAGQRLKLQLADETALYLVSGNATVAGTDCAAHDMLILEPGSTAVVEAHDDTRIAVIGGATLGERHIDWNFVSSSKQRIAQARQDWRDGRFATIPGDDAEFIPLPD